jgi:hypothetical protein
MEYPGENKNPLNPAIIRMQGAFNNMLNLYRQLKVVFVRVKALFLQF